MTKTKDEKKPEKPAPKRPEKGERQQSSNFGEDFKWQPKSWTEQKPRYPTNWRER